MASDCENEREKNSCCKSGVDFQEYPSEGLLYENMNLSFDEIKRIIENIDSPIYSYVLTTVDFADNQFIQQGCGPNFQGSLITLCTCKHLMRTYREYGDWKDVWIAGFTQKPLFENDRNYLFYLMKVGEEYESQVDLWNALTDDEKKAKNACNNDKIFGDVYEPKVSGLNAEDRYKPVNYKSPINGHVHNDEEEWKKDIRYHNDMWDRWPVLLKGDREKSYVWSEKKIYYSKGQHPRTTKWKDPNEFLDSLAPDN